MAKNLTGIEPQVVWDYFEEICNRPHPSKKEEKLAKYMVDWGNENNFEVQKDALGNIVIRKAATAGMENRVPIAIQGHIDMVCEKNSDVEFDFDNDPIIPVIKGDWIEADGTTLGADNGIGIAMGMAIMTSGECPHPAIELLCTLDEETGLTGAMELGDDILQAGILINLDSEEDGAFTIGCAGGLNTAAEFDIQSEAAPASHVAYEIVLKGLRGGHSGIEIHDERGNAAKLINRFLFALTNKFDVRMVDINSGNKHNAIPREAFANVTVEAGQAGEFTAYVDEFQKILKFEYATKEPNLALTAVKKDMPSSVFTKAFQKQLIDCFYASPHGVVRMSPDIKGLVQTSTTLAIVETVDGMVKALTSQRSSVESEKVDIGNMVAAAFRLGGARASHSDGYPAWEPNMNSPILKASVETFKGVFGKEPKIEAIHAGLECGLIGEKYPDMDMLSFGPNLKDVHSPDEMIQISSTERAWKLLKEIVKNIPVK